MKLKYLYFCTITVAMAGFLFGFDTAVISGADLPIQKQWNTSPFFHAWFIMSMALWGTVVGAIFGGYPTENWGRKPTLFAIGVLYFVSAVGSAFAWDPYSFSIFRFIGGLGVGASSVAAPIYISEISPKNDRGKLVATYQFSIVFGVLAAFVSNDFIARVWGANLWRWMLGLEAIPALIYTILILSVPESPRWLLLKKINVRQALETLKRLNPSESVDRIVEQIQNQSLNHVKKVRFFSKAYTKPILLVFALAFFNQLSGINFVLYYAPRIFEMAGLEAQSALSTSIGIGLVNLVFTILGIYLIDRVGRKKLLYLGTLGYVLSLSTLSWSFAVGASGKFVVWSIMTFIASHAVGQGAIIWVFIAEIFPTSVRSYGQSWGTGVHWVFAALITALTLPFIQLTGDNPAILFACFSFLMILQGVFAYLWMPETKGTSLEELI